ncbi:MAG: DNA-directed RNA polymerase subunit P [Candidatus Aenigmatarchaeota archaeon]
MNYICIKCKKEFELEDKVRCPLCGYRIIAKARPVFKKRVVAR